MYSDDAEQAVLGAILTEPAVLRVVRPLLEPGDFAGGDAAETYAAILTLADRGVSIDEITVVAELERDARSEAEARAIRDYVSGLRDSVPHAKHVEYHANLVVHHAKRRATLQHLRGAIAQLEQDTQPPADIAASVSQALTTLVEADPSLPRAVRLLDAQEPAPVRWLVDDFWLAGEVGLLVGDDGSYKSTAALAMACAIAGGMPVFDRFVCRRRPALYVSAEDPDNVLHARAEALIVGHGWNRGHVLENLHVMYDPDASLADEKWRAHIRAEVERTGAGLVVLDPLADLLGGDENSNADVRKILKFARGLTRVVGPGETAVPIVHHMGKKGDGKYQKREVDRIRGASAIRGAGRCNYAFEPVDGGVSVINMKMSRAPRLGPFVLELAVEHDPRNRAEWTSARLIHQSARQAAQNRGESFIVTQLAAVHPRRLLTTQLKDLAAESGHRVSGQDISTGLSTLSAKGLIDWQDGGGNRRLWGLTDAGLRSGAAGSARDGNPDSFDVQYDSYDLPYALNSDEPPPEELAGQVASLPGKLASRAAGVLPSDPAPPVRGAGRVGGSPAPTGNVGNPERHSPNGTPPRTPPRRTSPDRSRE